MTNLGSVKKTINPEFNQWIMVAEKYLTKISIFALNFVVFVRANRKQSSILRQTHANLTKGETECYKIMEFHDGRF